MQVKSRITNLSSQCRYRTPSPLCQLSDCRQVRRIRATYEEKGPDCRKDGNAKRVEKIARHPATLFLSTVIQDARSCMCGQMAIDRDPGYYNSGSSSGIGTNPGYSSFRQLLIRDVLVRAHGICQIFQISPHQCRVWSKNRAAFDSCHTGTVRGGAWGASIYQKPEVGRIRCSHWPVLVLAQQFGGDKKQEGKPRRTLQSIKYVTKVEPGPGLITSHYHNTAIKTASFAR
jgi:hypothetical protein